MVFTTAGGGASQLYPYEIDNSLRLTDNAYLNITRSSQSNTTGTFSAWIKTAAQNSFQLAGGHTDVNNRSYIYFPSSGDGFSGGIFSRTSGSLDLNFSTSAVYRDPSAWYHLVIAIDTTQSTESNRVKWYVNGQQITSFSASTYPSQNASIPILNKSAQTIGAGFGASAVSEWSDGYMAEVYYIDGTQYAASDFGEYNDNGVWIPKDASDNLTFGTNGFYLEFKQTGTGQNSSGIGADTSGNDNHLAVNSLSATDVTVDTPTNNFATMNPVHKSSHGSAALPTFSEGNLKIGMNSDSSTSSTIAPSKGKWYFEYKQGENTADNGGYPIVGISATLGGTAGDVIGFRTPDGSNYRGQLGTSSIDNAFLSAREAGDIFGFYIDLDNSTLIIHKNGSTYMNTGYTGGLDWSGGLTTTSLQTGFFHPYVQNNFDGTPAYTDEINFGNPSFSISSSNSDANGYGSFEYNPTLSGTNYYALCTKNLAEYG